MIALIFSSLILLIVVIGILSTISINKNKPKKTSPSPSTLMTRVSSIQPEDTSQNFATENTRRSIENLVRQLNENSSMNPYVNSNTNGSMDF